MALAIYFFLLIALFVRVDCAAQSPSMPRRSLRGAASWEVKLVRLHHGLFYLVLASSLAEYLVWGKPRLWAQVCGVALFVSGLALYRMGGRRLGVNLSPLLAPVSSDFCREGIYGVVRHPMYLGQILMAAGAPLVLGSYLSLLLALPFAGVVGFRVSREERLLCRFCPGYETYRRDVSRLIPFLY